MHTQTADVIILIRDTLSPNSGTPTNYTRFLGGGGWCKVTKCLYGLLNINSMQSTRSCFCKRIFWFQTCAPRVVTVTCTSSWTVTLPWWCNITVLIVTFHLTLQVELWPCHDCAILPCCFTWLLNARLTGLHILSSLLPDHANTPVNSFARAEWKCKLQTFFKESGACLVQAMLLPLSIYDVMSWVNTNPGHCTGQIIENKKRK